MGLGVFVVYTLSFLHVIGLKNCLLTPPSWDLTNILNDDSFLSPNFASSATRSIKKFSEPPPPEEAQQFERSDLGSSSIIVLHAGTEHAVIYILC